MLRSRCFRARIRDRRSIKESCPAELIIRSREDRPAALAHCFEQSLRFLGTNLAENGYGLAGVSLGLLSGNAGIRQKYRDKCAYWLGSAIVAFARARR